MFDIRLVSLMELSQVVELRVGSDLWMRGASIGSVSRPEGHHCIRGRGRVFTKSTGPELAYGVRLPLNRDAGSQKPQLDQLVLRRGRWRPTTTGCAHRQCGRVALFGQG